MGFEYRAFGLLLHSAMPLPGLPGGHAVGDPEVDVAIERDGEELLEQRWSGPRSPSAWRGWLRDGAELTIRWGRGRDLLFAYSDRARFHLDPTAARLLCAPADPAELDWQRVLVSRVLPLVAVARGFEALHAAAVDTDVGVVAVAAGSGAGKSTLAAALVDRGHPLVADDVLVLGPAEGGVRAHPAGAHLSLDPGVAASGRSLGVLGGKRWIVADDAAPKSRPLAAVATLDRGAGRPLAARRLAASPLALAPYMLGLPDDDDRDAARFALYADLAERTTLIALSAGADDSPAAIAAELEGAVGIGRAALAGSR